MAETTTTLLPPKISNWLSDAPAEYISFMGLATLNTLIVTVLSIVHLVYIRRYVGNRLAKDNLLWLGLLFPITSICCVISMYIPRSAEFLYIVGLTYMMLSLFFLVRLVVSFFGTIANLSHYLYSNGRRIFFTLPPVCCCCRCLPSAEPNEKNLRRVTFLVLQSPIARILIAIASIVILLEGVSPKDPVFSIINAIAIQSMILAIWGCQIMFALVREPLAPFGFTVIFRLVDSTQALYSLQKFGFDVAVATHRFSDDDLMPAASKAQFWFNFVVTLEMVLFSVLATILLRPARTQLAWQNAQIEGGEMATIRTVPVRRGGDEMRMRPLNRPSPPL